MRYLAVIIGIFVLSMIDSKLLSALPGPKADIKWEEMSLDFGEIPYNEPIHADFSFSNPGMLPLIITDVKTSCGCTVAEFPKEPLVAGATGTIRVTFDAKSPGYFIKTVTVYSNSQEGVTKLYIKGVVVK